MTEFVSRYPELAFYVEGSRRQFRGGKYKAEAPTELLVLRRLKDVTEVKTETKPAEEPPKPALKKAPAKRKTSAK